MAKFKEKPDRRFLVVERRGFHRKGFTITRGGKKIYIPPAYIPPTKIRVPDRGKPGRGEKVIPPLRKGAMNAVAKEMGYEKATEVPDSKLDEFVERLVERYGERRALGMINAQRIFRKRMADHGKSKFQKMYEIWQKKYAGGGWAS